MSTVNTALVFASDAAAEHSGPNAYIFGGFALAVLVLLLVVTMMIKVGD